MKIVCIIGDKGRERYLREAFRSEKYCLIYGLKCEAELIIYLDQDILIFEKNVYYLETKGVSNIDVLFQLYSLLDVECPLLNNINNSRFIGDLKYFIRSSNIENITDRQVKKLKEGGYVNIVSLKKLDSNVLKYTLNENSLEYLQSPFNISTSIKKSLNNFDLSLDDFYMYLVSQHEIIFNIFNSFFVGKTLFFCEYGKDRTGIVSFLVGLLCGFSKEELAIDYVKSMFYLLKNSEQKKTNYIKATDKILLATTIFKLYGKFNSKYHNINYYLKLIGFESKEITGLKEQFKNA